MKKYIVIAALVASLTTSYSQSLDYQDLSLLFSQNDVNGTARFTAMSGAFGALGGDISSININPAGLSVFNNSSFSGTLNSRTSDINTNYYGNNLLTQDQFINFSQAGAVLVFDTSYTSDWSKFAMGFNYRITKDFNNSFLAQGNSNIATFTQYPLDINEPALEYGIADEQRFRSDFGGELTELNIAFSSLYDNNLHLGIGFNFFDLNFNQQSNLTEFNSDVNGNELDANLYQENFITGVGFSANLGLIYKVNPGFRVGLSYLTPTWFSEIIEENNLVNNDGYIGDTEIIVSNDNLIYDNTTGGNFPFLNQIYRLRTPGSLTASAAFIFGKIGLLSVDYTNKNYRNIKLSGANFGGENQFFQNDVFFQNQLRNTHNYRIGTEWRFDRVSIRGGYRFEQSPNINNTLNGVSNALDDISVINFRDLTGHSFGGGYNFGKYKIDLSYSNTNRNTLYNFYQGFNVDAANLTLDNRVFSATFTLSL